VKRFVIFLTVFLILFDLFGCAGCVKVQSKDSLNEGITITKLNLDEDHYGGQHIVGEIRNENSFPVQSIKMKVSITDANGETVLRDARNKPIPEALFNPFLNILFPGESSGFDYSLSPLASTAADYQVTFSSALKANTEKADVRIEKTHIQHSMYGTSFFMGEVVNHGSQPARVEGLGVAVLGEDGKILDTNVASSLVQYLAPAKDPDGLDKSTFSIPLRGSFGDRVQWQTYISSVITGRMNLPAVHILESHQFVDSLGYFHLIGLIGNESPIPFFFPLLGSLLEKNGDVLDSAAGYLPVDMQPGSVSAFDLLDWKVVNHNVALQAMIHETKIQIDPSRIFPSKQRYFQLIPSNVQESRNDQGVWTIKGRINNFWPIPFRSIVVIVSIFSGQNHLVATNYQWVHPINILLEGGRKAQFDLQVFLDPTRDPLKYTYQVQAIAVSPW